MWRNLELQSVYGTAAKILAYLILIFKRELVHVHFGGDIDICRQFACRQVLRNGYGSHHAVIENGVDEGDGEVLRVLRDVHITGVSHVHLECHVELTVLVGVLVLRHVARYGRHLYLRFLVDFGACSGEVVDVDIVSQNTDAAAVGLLRDVHLHVGCCVQCRHGHVNHLARLELAAFLGDGVEVDVASTALALLHPDARRTGYRRCNEHVLTSLVVRLVIVVVDFQFLRTDVESATVVDSRSGFPFILYIFHLAIGCVIINDVTPANGSEIVVCRLQRVIKIQGVWANCFCTCRIAYERQEKQAEKKIHFFHKQPFFSY